MDGLDSGYVRDVCLAGVTLDMRIALHVCFLFFSVKEIDSIRYTV